MIYLSKTFQTEKELEEELIDTLVNQGYDYRPDIRGEKFLKANLRVQLERLNSSVRGENFRFSDREWFQFYEETFKGRNNEGFLNRTKKIQWDGYRKELRRDDGRIINIELIHKRNPQYNYLQVINQYSDYETKNRYDVTILVNGLPLVHIEIKRRGLSLSDAFNQINRYKRESFQNLFEFIQIFIISNGTETRYYSNTTEFNRDKNSFLFTSEWTTEKNKHIKDLINFAKTFLSRHTLLEVLTKFCVLGTDGNLKILRPYQIAAIKNIIWTIKKSIVEGGKLENLGGYVWHTTGSGKTLTSFKAAQLAKEIPEIKKVLFVVDRKDLDSQTHREFEKFLGKTHEQCIDSTLNTEELRKLLVDNEKRVIVTTIQKLNNLLKNFKQEILSKFEYERVVIIMDECHRSQTKRMHDLIKGSFKKLNLFGFTGTPLLKLDEKTRDTDETFGKALHKYQIIDAIHDGNVLGFWVDYVGYRYPDLNYLNLESDERIERIVEYIIRNFDIKTNPSTIGEYGVHVKTKFNSMLAVSSIKMAIKYYKEFIRQLDAKKRDLKIAIIFSARDDAEDPNANENKEDDDFPQDQKGFYEMAKTRYEQQFKTGKIYNFNQYRDSISDGVKKRKIDLLIVVNMFQTGFDAPSLNTIWIDKDLKDHNLIQTFSRTNRIYDRSKPHGNVVCFRDLVDAVDKAVYDYAGGPCVFVNSFEEKIKEFSEVEDVLLTEFPVDQEIIGEERENKFIEVYKKFTSLAQVLSCDERFEDHRKIDFVGRQDYRSKFLGIYEKRKKDFEKLERTFKDEEEEISEVISFDLEILRTDEINEDYILKLINNYRYEKDREKILRNTRMNTKWRKKEQIIIDYLQRIDNGEEDLDYSEHEKQKREELTNELIERMNLNKEGTKRFIDGALEEGRLYFGGKGVASEIMPVNIKPLKEHEKYKDIWAKVKEAIKELYEIFINV